MVNGDVMRTRNDDDTRDDEGVDDDKCSVAVRPFATEIHGAESPVEQGSVVNLVCRTNGSRPAAVLTWYNGSQPFATQPTGQVALQVIGCRCRHLVTSFDNSNFFRIFLVELYFPTSSSLPNPVTTNTLSIFCCY